MRVLFDHQVFSLQNAGGQTRYFYELAKFLSTVQGAQTEIWMGINGTVHPFDRIRQSRVIGFPEWLRPGMARYMANELWSNTRALFRGKLDVYHPTHLMRMPMVRAGRVVATHHDCTHERFPQYFSDAKKIYWARKRLFPEVDAIICVSESSRRDLIHFYNVDPAKTVVIHHGLTQLPRSEAAAAWLKRNLRRDYILFVGMRPRFKNFDGLLRAFHDSKLHQELDLLVLGGQPFTDEERALMKQLGLEECVIHLPQATDEVMAEAYVHAMVFVYPSFNEGFGLPLLEAMSLNCPVLASRIASTEEICGDAPFYFDPNDRDSFSSGLVQAVNQAEARERAVECGRSVTSRYSWERCGQETLALYRA